MEFKCVGTGEKSWSPTEEQLSAWKKAYPGVTLDVELFKMAAWLDANPARRKTAKGMARFVVNWLNSSQNRSANGGRRHYDSPPDYSDALPRSTVATNTAELRLAIERAVRAEHPDWNWSQVRIECAKRFNEKMAGITPA
jgi:hypothetical protein